MWWKTKSELKQIITKFIKNQYDGNIGRDRTLLPLAGQYNTYIRFVVYALSHSVTTYGNHFTNKFLCSLQLKKRSK